jgi:hypothetical protein
MATTVFKSGKNALITVNGTNLSTTGWDVQATVKKVEFINSDTGTIAIPVGTTNVATVTLTMDFNFAQSMFGAPISVYPGALLNNVICYLAGSSGLNWNFTSLFVNGTPQKTESEGKPAQSINCSLAGPYTPPGGTQIGIPQT